LFTGQLDWTECVDGTFSIGVSKSGAYPLIVGRGELAKLPELLQQILESDSVFIVTDDCVSDFLLDITTRLLRNSSLRVQTVIIPAGEGSKSWATTEKVLSCLSSGGARRRTILLALGGGVVCDLVGFVASIFMRGIPYVCIPTSLIAQLDAAIGGKTGIDFNGSKNLVGTFHHPVAVLVDPDLLVTLPQREIRSGLAEAIKVGVLLDRELFARLELMNPLLTTDIASLAAIVEDAIVSKIQLLRDDPFERSLARLLNLGHTVGHAIEAATRFDKYRHGEAVAIGMGIATEISRGRNLCSLETRERILSCLENCGLDVALPLEYFGATFQEVDVIRRIRNGKLNEVLPIAIGECVIVDEVSIDEYEAAVHALIQRSAKYGS
jgi:3-dehydroquinate synthase